MNSYVVWQYIGLPRWLSGKESTWNVGDTGNTSSVSGLGRSPGEENGNPLQYTCLGNLMSEEPGGLQSMGVTKSQTWLGSSVQFSRSVVSYSATPWTAARQAFLSITNSRSMLKLMSFKSVIPSNNLISVVPFSSGFNLSQHQGLFPISQFFASSSQSIKLQPQHQSFQWLFRTDFL